MLRHDRDESRQPVSRPAQHPCVSPLTDPRRSMTTTDDPLEKRVNTVGRLLPHVAAKIVDPADPTRVVPIGQPGELAVNGYLVMKGYWGDAAKTAEVMVPDEEGLVWMHVRRRPSSTLPLLQAAAAANKTIPKNRRATRQSWTSKATSRSPADSRVCPSPLNPTKRPNTKPPRNTDIIIRGGENIHPLDVENCLLAHDAVADVSCCAVPDARYGEAVAVFVVRRPGAPAPITAAEARAWVREKLSGQFGASCVLSSSSSESHVLRADVARGLQCRSTSSGPTASQRRRAERCRGSSSRSRQRRCWRKIQRPGRGIRSTGPPPRLRTAFRQCLPEQCTCSSEQASRHGAGGFAKGDIYLRVYY